MSSVLENLHQSLDLTTGKAPFQTQINCQPQQETAKLYVNQNQTVRSAIPAVDDPLSAQRFSQSKLNDAAQKQSSEIFAKKCPDEKQSIVFKDLIAQGPNQLPFRPNVSAFTVRQNPQFADQKYSGVGEFAEYSSEQSQNFRQQRNASAVPFQGLPVQDAFAQQKTDFGKASDYSALRQGLTQYKATNLLNALNALNESQRASSLGIYPSTKASTTSVQSNPRFGFTLPLLQNTGDLKAPNIKLPAFVGPPGRPSLKLNSNQSSQGQSIAQAELKSQISAVLSPSLFIQKDSMPMVLSDSFSEAKKSYMKNVDQFPDFLSQYSNGIPSETQTFGQARSPNQPLSPLERFPKLGSFINAQQPLLIGANNVIGLENQKKQQVFFQKPYQLTDFYSLSTLANTNLRNCLPTNSSAPIALVGPTGEPSCIWRSVVIPPRVKDTGQMLINSQNPNNEPSSANNIKSASTPKLDLKSILSTIGSNLHLNKEQGQNVSSNSSETQRGSQAERPLRLIKRSVSSSQYDQHYDRNKSILDAQQIQIGLSKIQQTPKLQTKPLLHGAFEGQGKNRKVFIEGMGIVDNFLASDDLNICVEALLHKRAKNSAPEPIAQTSHTPTHEIAQQSKSPLLPRKFQIRRKSEQLVDSQLQAVVSQSDSEQDGLIQNSNLSQQSYMSSNHSKMCESENNGDNHSSKQKKVFAGKRSHQCAFGISKSSSSNSMLEDCKIQKRLRKNNDQYKLLLKEFQHQQIWSKQKIVALAQTVGLKQSQIYKWNWDMQRKIKSASEQDQDDVEVPSPKLSRHSGSIIYSNNIPLKSYTILEDRDHEDLPID